MAYIWHNDKLRNDTAIVWLRSGNADYLSYKKDGDFYFINDDEGIVGINVQNSSKYLRVKEGFHVLAASEKKKLQIADIDQTVSHFVVGEVTSRDVHEKSKRLFVLKVSIGNEVIQIVTNTLSSTVGKKVVVALPGAITSSGLEINLSKVMGIKSHGMLVGHKSLGFDNPNNDEIVYPEGNLGDLFIF